METSFVVAVSPRPYVTCSQVFKAIHACHSASRFNLSDIFLEDALPTAGKNYLDLLGLRQRPIGLYLPAEMLLPLRERWLRGGEIGNLGRCIKKDACFLTD